MSNYFISQIAKDYGSRALTVIKDRPILSSLTLAGSAIALHAKTDVLKFTKKTAEASIAKELPPAVASPIQKGLSRFLPTPLFAFATTVLMGMGAGGYRVYVNPEFKQRTWQGFRAATTSEYCKLKNIFGHTTIADLQRRLDQTSRQHVDERAAHDATRNLFSDYTSTMEAKHSTLQAQHAETSAALTTQQKETANLTERLSFLRASKKATETEMETLKERLRVSHDATQTTSEAAAKLREKLSALEAGKQATGKEMLALQTDLQAATAGKRTLQRKTLQLKAEIEASTAAKKAAEEDVEKLNGKLHAIELRLAELAQDNQFSKLLHAKNSSLVKALEAEKAYDEAKIEAEHEFNDYQSAKEQLLDLKKPSIVSRARNNEKHQNYENLTDIVKNYELINETHKRQVEVLRRSASKARKVAVQAEKTYQDYDMVGKFQQSQSEQTELSADLTKVKSQLAAMSKRKNELRQENTHLRKQLKQDNPLV